jgi:hypothetical protein
VKTLLAAIAVSGSLLWAGVAMAAEPGDPGSAAAAGTPAPAAVGTVAAPPQFSGLSGDFSLSDRPGVGVLRRDKDGLIEPGFYVGTLSNRRAVAVTPDWARPGEPADTKAWDIGGVIGYQMSDGLDPRSGGGINLQVVTSRNETQPSLLLQPGVDYSIPFSESLSLSARIFSTYVPQESERAQADAGAAAAGPKAAEGEGGWRDVGVNLGVGYTVNERWTIETQAGITRSLVEEKNRTGTKEDRPVADIFGGVFLNYRF